MGRDGGQAAFLESGPISVSSPMPIPSSRGEACCSSASSSFWGSVASSHSVPSVPQGGWRNVHFGEARASRMNRKPSMSIAEVEEAAATLSLQSFSSPHSVPYGGASRLGYADDYDSEDDDEADEPSIHPHSTGAIEAGSLSRRPGGSFLHSMRPSYLTLDAQFALRNVDHNLSYLSLDMRLKATKALTVAVESCTSFGEIARCRSVFNTLTELEMDTRTLEAGLFAATSIPRERLRRTLEPDVFRLVDSWDSLHQKLMGTLDHDELSEAQFNSTLDNLSDVRLVAIELAVAMDLLRNASRQRRPDNAEYMRSFAKLTLQFYAPLAHSCGFGFLQKELEERAFQFKYPAEFEALRAQLSSKARHISTVLESSKKMIESALWNDCSLRAQVSCVRVSGRQKSLYSIHRKMQRKNLPLSQVYDMLAVRVILTPRMAADRAGESTEVEACYRAMQIVQEQFQAYGDDRVKDYIANPKDNGYQSLHTTLSVECEGESFPLELQIRSEAMHRQAETGSAAHTRYKGDSAVHSYPHISNMRYCKRFSTIH